MAKQPPTVYSAKEKAELLLSNLEKLKAEVAVTEVRYDMKADYTEMCEDAILRISEIRTDLEKGALSEDVTPTPGRFQSIINKAADCIEFGLDKIGDGIIFPAETMVHVYTSMVKAANRKGEKRHST